MESTTFKDIRARLDKTQKQLSQLLGISIKAVHSYEQGWRKIPHHVERQLLFLYSRIFLTENQARIMCWDFLDCPEARQKNCPAREFNAGDLCWFINGTQCSGKIHDTWQEKMADCRTCKVFNQFFTSDT